MARELEKVLIAALSCVIQKKSLFSDVFSIMIILTIVIALNYDFTFLSTNPY